MSEATEKPAAAKKPISEKQRLANIANSKKSTGPRTIAGKNICKWAGLRHGMRAEHDVIPGESQQEFDELLAAHLEEYNPQTPLQHLFVERATSAFQKLQRGDRVEEALAARIQNAAAAATVVPGLAAEPEGPTLDTLIKQLPEDPAGTIRQIRRTLEGCLWIREQLLTWQKRMETEPGLLPSQRELSLHLLGKRMSDAYRDDAVATRWVIAHLGTLFGDRPGLDASKVLVNTGMPGPPIDRHELMARADELIGQIPEGARQSKVLLQGYLAEELARLDEHIEIMTEFADRDRSLEIAAAEIPLTPEGKQLLGYVTNQRVSYEAALRRLDALQNPRRSGPDGGPATASRKHRPKAESPVPAAPVGARDVEEAATPPFAETAAESGTVATEDRVAGETEPEDEPETAVEVTDATAAEDEDESATADPISAGAPTIDAEVESETTRPISAGRPMIEAEVEPETTGPISAGGHGFEPERRPRTTRPISRFENEDEFLSDSDLEATVARMGEQVRKSVYDQMVERNRRLNDEADEIERQQRARWRAEDEARWRKSQAAQAPDDVRIRRSPGRRRMEANQVADGRNGRHIPSSPVERKRSPASRRWRAELEVVLDAPGG